MFCKLPYQLCRLLQPCNSYKKIASSRKIYSSAMSGTKQHFTGQLDRYNGVIIYSSEEPCDITIFPMCLKTSLEEWRESKKNTIWFYVDLKQADWVPHLIKEDFKYHHAKDECVVLYKWLSNEICNVPPYAHTTIGIGAFVYNDKTKEILTVKEKVAIRTMWKLPGGYIEPEEDLAQAVEREVLEETGIQSKFKCFIGFRHSHQHIFGCSDIYMIAHLIPSTYEIKKSTMEISECEWMKLDVYAAHPEVHINNRFAAKKMIEHLNSGIGIDATYGIHPITKKPFCMYSISQKSDS